MTTLADRLRLSIRDVPDFPKPGIVFKDLTPIFTDVPLFSSTIEAMIEPFMSEPLTHVIGIESRGFLFAAPVAYKLGLPLVPVRKPGKLPRMTYSEHYALEYGSDSLEIHRDALGDDARVLIVDDLLATGGTMSAAVRLVARLGGTVSGVSVVVDLSFLPWRDRLGGQKVSALVDY